MKYFLIVGLIILTGLCIVDSWSTYIILQNGGEEINPVMNWLMSKIGVENALIYPKLICLLILVHGMKKVIEKPLKPYKMRLIAFTYIALIGLYSVVVYNSIPYMLERISQ